jgi:tetratricopeptide (TPR) repeat protein
MTIPSPRIAVYAIARNAERTIDRWFDSAVGADEILLVDTGSTDETVDRGRHLGAEVRRIRVEPFRFDQARNCALDFVSHDIDLCIPLDLDEILVSGWLEQLRAIWTPGATRVEYWFEWRWSSTYVPLRYRTQKIHARHGYRWRRPVHEQPVTSEPEKVVPSSLEIHHLRESWGPRQDYLDLLRLAIAECPDDGQAHHMLANEARVHGLVGEARRHAEMALALPLHPFERMHTMLMLSWLDIHSRESWILAACHEFQDQREPWCELAKLHSEAGRWRASRSAALAALRLKKQPYHYLTDVFAWGHLPDQLAAEASLQLGDRDQALHHVRQALAAAPHFEGLGQAVLSTT